MGHKEMGSNKVSRVFNLPHKTLRYYVKDRQKNSCEAIKTKQGRKQVLPCEVENNLAEHCRLIERMLFGLKMAESCISPNYLLSETELKAYFAKEMKRLDGSGWKMSHVVIKKFQLQPLKMFTLKSEGFHALSSSSVFFNLRTRYVHHST